MIKLESILSNLDACLPIKASRWFPIDLSAQQVSKLGLDLSKKEDIEAWFKQQLSNDTVAYGGYMELRSWYGRNPGFVASEEVRNLHIGLDIWDVEGSPVYAALDGVVHSFANNNAAGDYGHTLILEHHFNGEKFFSLYGHLAPFNSTVPPGKIISKGEEIARLGSWDENGNWPSHLHFQIIADMQDYHGDYPGTCFNKDKEKFKALCPDPQFLLDIPK